MDLIVGSTLDNIAGMFACVSVCIMMLKIANLNVVTL